MCQKNATEGLAYSRLVANSADTYLDVANYQLMFFSMVVSDMDSLLSVTKAIFNVRNCSSRVQESHDLLQRAQHLANMFVCFGDFGMWTTCSSVQGTTHSYDSQKDVFRRIWKGQGFGCGKVRFCYMSCKPNGSLSILWQASARLAVVENLDLA